MPASLTAFAVVDAHGGVSYPASSPSMSSTEPALAHGSPANVARTAGALR
jgi:hypothetical protein